MTKRIAVTFAVALMVAMVASAQKPKDGAATPPEMSKKTVSLSGRVSTDGKTLVTESDGVVWTFVNPDALAENAGARVVVRGYVNATAHEIEVTSVRIDTVAGARLHDAAFHR